MTDGKKQDTLTTVQEIQDPYAFHDRRDRHEHIMGVHSTTSDSTMSIESSMVIEEILKEPGSSTSSTDSALSAGSEEFLKKHSAIAAARETNLRIAHLSYSPAEEKKLLRKYDLHILSFLCIIYMLSFMDRTNIGNAYQAGMAKRLGLDHGSDYALILNVFYIGYILFQWCILLWKVWRPSIFVPFVVISWGIVSSCQGAVTNWTHLIATRFILGALEAAFSPGVYYYLSFYYHRTEMAKRVGVFQSFSPLSSSFSGAIAYAVTKYANPKIMEPWRLLFVIEGLPSIVCGFIAFYAIYDGPYKCRFLTPREKDIARARTLAQAGSVDRGGSSISLSDTIAVLKDPKIWFHTLLYFSMNVASVPIPIFLPTILAGIGYTDIAAQGMSAPPYLAAVVAILAVCYFSDKYTQRAYAIVGCCGTALIGYLMLALPGINAHGAAAESHYAGVRYFGLFLAIPGVYASHAIIMTWTGDNQGTDSKRGMGYILLHVFGLTGPILGTRLFPKSTAPRYVRGISITMGFVFLTLVVSLIYRAYLARLNRKLDMRYGVVHTIIEERKQQGQFDADNNSDEKNMCMDENSPLYRFVL